MRKLAEFRRRAMKRRSTFSYVGMVVGGWFLGQVRGFALTTSAPASSKMAAPAVPELSDVPSALLVLSGIAGLFGYRHWRKTRAESSDSGQA